jgi:type I restriction enzyme S subunit
MNRWPIQPLGKIALDLQPGFASRPDADSAGILHLRPLNLTEEGLLIDIGTKRVPSVAGQLHRYSLRPGDILFNNTNSPELVGKVAIFRLDGAFVFSNHLTRIRVDRNKILPEFLQRFLFMLWRDGYFKQQCTQWINQAAININALASLPVPVPPIVEQERIVQILDEAETLRRLRAQADKRTNALIPALFEQMFGDPLSNPKHWTTMRLRDTSEKFSDGPFGSNLKSEHYTQEGIRVIRLQNIGVGSFIDDDKAFIAPQHFDRLRRHECRPGDVLVGTLGEPNLRACLLPTHIEHALNKADCVQIRPKLKQVTSEYLCWLLNLPSTLSMASGMIAGQTRSRISMGRLAELMVPVPPIDLQNTFASHVAEIHDFQTMQPTSHRRLDDLFESLLHRAFEGDL